MRQSFFLLCCALLLVLTACTEPITVGGDLLEGDRATVGQITDLPFTTSVVREDTIVTFDASSNAALAAFTFGQMRNDVFGELKHGVYIIPTLPRSTATGLVNAPAFAFDDGTLVDSVVLFLPIDTSAGLYGNGANFPIRMIQLADAVDQNVDYGTDVNLVRGFNELQREPSFSVDFEATLLYDTIISSGDSVLFPHIRIAFDDQFLGQLNAQDESIWRSDTTFYEFLAGMYIEPTDDSGSLVTIQPQPTAGGQSPFAGLFWFYQDTLDQSPTFYRTPLSLWLPRYEQDYAGSFFETLLAPGADNDQFAIAGQAGVMTEINFPNLQDLQDVVINEAVLTLYRDDVTGLDYEELPAPTFTALYYRDENGNLVPIEDRQRLGNPNSSTAIRQFLGGDPQEDEAENVFYSPRFSVHMQRMVDGEVPPTIYLRTVPIDRDPARMILAGPEAAVRPASVRVTFTELE